MTSEIPMDMEATMRTKIVCGKCGSDVRITQKVYGGMRRMVCSQPDCPESEQSFQD